jgi:hypothetical protein
VFDLPTYLETTGVGDRLRCLANAMGWGLEFAGDSVVFDGWLELWPPEAKVHDAQIGWIASWVSVTPGVRTFNNGDPGYPDCAESVDLGEFDKLERAVASLAKRWLEQEEENDALAKVFDNLRGDE